MNNVQRIGVYGGTFDPVHRAHVEIAKAAMAHARLDRVLFVVAASPPHKTGDVFASAEVRLALVEAALEAESGMEASRIEIDRKGPSYTADTLEQVRRSCAGAALFLILGFDSLVDLPHWRRPEIILESARILAVPRPGAQPAIPPSLEGHYELLPFKETDISSTEIRNRLANGGDVAHLLPPTVLRLIRAEGYYHACRQEPEV